MYDIPLIKPYLPSGTFERVQEVLESGYLTEGAVTGELEKRVADYTGAEFALAVNSCMTGLEMALRALDVKTGDEVIVPDYTHPATASAVALTGASIKLVDIDEDTLCIDYDAIESAITPRTKAVLPVSQFGNPLNYDRLHRIREERGIYVVEDAACALGAAYKDRRVGVDADISVFSFHPRKFVTTGEGGLIVTNNEEWHSWMTSYKHFGVGYNAERDKAEFIRFGTNYKLSNIAAAVGITQLECVDDLLVHRRYLAQRYVEQLATVENVTLPSTPEGGTPSYQTFCIRVPDCQTVLEYMRNKGIEAQIGTYALHQHTAYAEGTGCEHHGDLRNSRQAFDTVLALPLYHQLTERQQDQVVEELQNALNQ